MLVAVGALIVAVATTVAYRLLTEHLEYASVRRRQLDVWAAGVAVLCLAGVVYGTAAARRSARPGGPAPDGGPGTSPAPVKRQGPVRLDGGSEEGPAPAGEGLLTLGPPPGVGSAQPTPAAIMTARRVPDEVGSVASPTLLLQLPLPATPKVPPPPPDPAPTVLPTTTFEAGGGPNPLPPPATSTPPAPTALPPTAAPTALPTATPHCGDPAQIEVRIEDLRTRRRTVGRDLVVEFAFDVRNRSEFPVTLVDMRATVSRIGAGSEQFASMALEDVTIEAGAVYPVARRVTLEARPPPVGTVQLCITYAAESCGQRVPYSVGSQCQRVPGF